MKTKIIQSIPAVLALFAIGFSYFSLWCIDSVSYCYGSLIHRLYQYFTSPFYFFSLFFLPIAAILVFVSRNIFSSWLKFSAWAIPLSIFYIATTPVNFTGIGMDFFPFYRDDAARLAGGIFAAASLILIIWKSIVGRQQKRGIPQRL